MKQNPDKQRIEVDESRPLALQWNRFVCDVISDARLPPTLAARTLAMVHTAMYDAWTAYTGDCYISTTTGDRLKRPEAEHTKENREIAFSYAAWRVLDALFADSFKKGELQEKVAPLWAGLKRCRLEDVTLDVTTPQGIGNLSAKLIVECRRGDGSNPDKYSDYTGYQPVNPPPPELVVEVDRWQPQLDSAKRPQKFLHPHWGLVKTFSLECGGQLRLPPPAPAGSGRFRAQMEDIIRISAGLTDREKLIAEYWAGMHEDKVEDTPVPTGTEHRYWTVPPVQCCRIARYVATRNCFRNSNVIKMFFAVSNALLDASIAAWDCKAHYDYCRPDSVIRHVKDDEQFEAWGGPCRGTVEMEGEGWCPYIPTPPFAEYPSGHSTFSHALAEILRCFCGNDEYGECITFPAGSSVVEPNCTPAEELTLTWYTLGEAADQAGMSRRYGGIHFCDGDMNGRQLGKEVARLVWRKVCCYFRGIPSPQ
ncbi:MAG TPA: vanadium-dependent haloperoxidase [Nitrospira sp.]|nr:vanadium-dependent haloperoxidase [Nitrospira sp.]HNN43129.1 vanadium-dependent haloperoxidase [Nitrospira sp.]HUM40705.1 vanadium-dependent haloperoxidase [Nitrospira sp.]